VKELESAGAPDDVSEFSYSEFLPLEAIFKQAAGSDFAGFSQGIENLATLWHASPRRRKYRRRPRT
jgi:hypothetical protein